MKKYQSEITKIRMLLLESQIGFAKRLGISSGAVSNWETGRRNPSITNIKKIKEIFSMEGIEFDFSRIINK